MKLIAAQKSKTCLPGWIGSAFALLLAVLLAFAANPDRPVHAAGEVTVTYIHTDISGNPLAATDENGNLVWKESYQPFGARTQYSPASEQQTQWFHGKEQDATTGLQYFGARWYDPETGRFLGIDPVGFQDGNLHSFNRYAYGNNNPLRYVDPDGNDATAAFGGLLTEGYNFATGNGFNGGMVWGALLDGYNGEGAGFWRSAGRDFLNFGGGSAVAGAAIKGWRILQSSLQTTRVGRWMSQAEYNAMKASGKVQESITGTTHVANPADKSAFFRQARSGDMYVEFNVPASSLKQTGDSWAKNSRPQNNRRKIGCKKWACYPSNATGKKYNRYRDKTMSLEILESFAEWCGRQNFSGETCLTRGADFGNKAFRLDVDASRFIAILVYWSSGDYVAEILDMASGKNIYWKSGTCCPVYFSTEFSEFLEILKSGDVGSL